jgi:tetratricopeptide (TPR) repeat protein
MKKSIFKLLLLWSFILCSFFSVWAQNQPGDQLKLFQSSDLSKYNFNVEKKARQLAKNQDVLEFEIALKLKPDYPDPKVNLAVMLARNNKHDEAISIYESLLLSDNGEQLDLEVIKYSLSFSYLALGFLELGWKYYDYGFNFNINSNSRRSPTRGFKKPKWDGIIRKNYWIPEKKSYSS